MLSYQHIYHAGCPADVHKHMALSIILSMSVDQYDLITYIDTHSGRGRYNIASAAALKTGEASFGVLRIMDCLNDFPVVSYAKILLDSKKKFGINYYPGSPMIARFLLRKMDVLHCIEAHPREYISLEKFARKHNIFTHYADSYSLAPEIISKAKGLSIVLIDPSYEVKIEYKACSNFIKSLSNKYKNTIILCWVPILSSAMHKVFLYDLSDTDGLWKQEVLFNIPYKMLGSMLLCLNAPTFITDNLNDLQEVMQKNVLGV
ncbi:23S rRNA (adenine2030-N6)-methyltransferase [Candidatus Xenohaliotis californiensis]|uniref:23S rRNA (Adenine2030-N6)-methyltransferase n=1 Tax=Candidatus Xenohaliotis californiensis TaxID=84677 RepID=A0ABM9N857_9RICK|nr:23S rRNA (adenine2030-N6)-methyltransferase [Candidatus Xenohaliotis californiensis]